MAEKKKETKTTEKNNDRYVLQINNMQYVLSAGESTPIRVEVDAQADDLEVNVLAVLNEDKIEYGTPNLKQKAKFELGDVIKGEKVVKKTFKAKSRYRRKVGHRPKYREFKLIEVK